MKKHVKSKLFAVLLSFLMVFTLIPGMSAFAEDTPSKSTDTVSVSKTAAKREVTDEDLTTDVTLSLPATEQTVTKQKVDIVFVMDASGYADTVNILKESDSLFSRLADSDAYDAKIGVIKFAGWGNDAIKDYAKSQGLDANTYKNLVPLNKNTKDNIRAAMARGGTNGVGGSNSEQPMRMANAMLEKYGDKDAAKYVVMLSDFATYIWEGNARMGNKLYDHVPVGTATSQNWNGSWFRPAYTQVTVWDDMLGDWYGAKYGRPSAPADKTYSVDNVWKYLWQDYDKDQRLIPGTDWGQDEIFVRKMSESSWINYDYSGEFDNQPQTKYVKDANYAADCEALWKSVKGVYGYGTNQKPHVGGVYRSAVLTYDAFTQALDAGTNLVIYCSTDMNYPLQNSIMHGMLNDLSRKKNVQIYNKEYKVDQSKLSNVEGMDAAVRGLEKQLTHYLIQKGTVTDEIGDKFDLVVAGDVCPFSVKLGDTALTATKTADNVWSFGKENEEGVYPYVLTYVPASDAVKESIKWDINVPVDETQKLSLAYKVKLIDTSESGEFDTNNSATLKYTSTDGTTSQQAFEKPKVKYTKPCNVTFMDGNTKIAEVKVESGKSINSDALADQSMPQDPTSTDPTKKDYTFTGWNTKLDGSGDAFTGDTTVKEDMTVYAQWTKEFKDNSGILPGDLLIGSDTEHDAVSVQKKDTSFAITANLNVQNIKDELANLKAATQLDEQHKITVKEAETTFTGILTLPEGLEFSSETPTVTLNAKDKDGNELFKVAKSTVNGKQLTVKMTLAKDNPTFEDIDAAVNGVEKYLSLTVDGIQFADSASANTNYTMTGTLTGNFKATAVSQLSGKINKYDYTWNAEQEKNPDGTDAAAQDPNSKAITLTVKYQETEGKVIVNYADENGKTVAESVTLSGKTGETYTTEKKTIDGYTFKEMGKGSAATVGKYTDGTLTVTYVYKQNETPQPPETEGKVIVNYVDENGNPIIDPITLTGDEGDPYTTEKKSFDGYTFKEMGKDSAAAEGKFTDGSLTVTYVYKKNATPGGTVAPQKPDQSKEQPKAQPSKKANPQTGDSSNMMLYGIISLGAGLALFGLAVSKRRKLSEK